MIHETIDLLGRRGKDKITGFEGVISTASFDLYGCVQVVLAPPVDKDGKLPPGNWFDIHRVIVLDDRVMDVPDFKALARKPSEYTHGAAEKPPM